MKEQKRTVTKTTAKVAKPKAALEAKSARSKDTAPEPKLTEAQTKEGQTKPVPKAAEVKKVVVQEQQKQPESAPAKPVQPAAAPQQKNQPRHQAKQQQDHRRRNGNGHQQYVPLDKRPIGELSLTELNLLARKYGIVGAGLMAKDALVERIKYAQAHPELEMEVEGVRKITRWFWVSAFTAI